MKEEKKTFRQQLNKPLFNSDYIIDKAVGAGGMSSEVYLVHKEKQPNKFFAAKVIYCEGSYTKDFIKRFGNEAITSLRVWNKKNVVQTYEVFPTKNDEALVFIMDYIDGISLRKYMDQQGCIGTKPAISIFRKILIGVQQLHSFNRQIIHRDLKPENILLSKDLSKVTVIDFGIATVIEKIRQGDEDKEVKVHTDEEMLWGTWPYVIPDALNKAIKPNVQFDFYSLGVILYRMIMGQFPFIQKANSQAAIIRLPLTYDIPNISSNPTIPVALENIIFRCMACKKEDLQYRYNDIQEIIDDLDRVDIKKKNEGVLLKPINKRRYQQAYIFMQDIIERKQKWYRHWWAFALLGGLWIFQLALFIILFFVI